MIISCKYKLLHVVQRRGAEDDKTRQRQLASNKSNINKLMPLHLMMMRILEDRSQLAQ